MNTLIVALLSIVFTICTLLKIVNIYYHKKLNNLRNQISMHTKIELLDKDASYDNYKRISKKTSVLNSPTRPINDFLEFITLNIVSDANCIENNLISLGDAEHEGTD